MTGLTKTAKIINPKMVNATLNYLDGTRHPIRNRLIFLLSVKLGLRAKEIACLTWSMILDAEGDFTDVLTLDNSASKGKRGGRVIPLSQTITDALSTHFDTSTRTEPHYRIIQTERSDKVAPQVIVNMFQRWFADLGYEGCSSHSGRRTFITNASKKISSVGGSLRDIQYLAGHSSLQTTQRYIEGDSRAREKVVELV
jgi:integrase/recombinase XerD|tara:strand:+ start:213 stop:806 length:594 start_codon:yes stop_codon:yes gene_type:complete